MNRVKIEPHGFCRQIPLAPHQMHDRVTRPEDVIVLCHLGVPRIPRAEWSLSIGGLVAHPLTLSFDDLARRRKVEMTSIHQCAGSPLQPRDPTRRICNVTWGGVRLAELLEECRPDPAATYVWSQGADFGEFGGVAADSYVKDLPTGRIGSDVLVAYEMNGRPLTDEHGFPARLVVPGYYGTNSTKWLTRLTLADRRAGGPFTTRWYNDPVLDDSGRDTGDTRPVWAIAPESLIVSPAPEAALAVGAETEIWGWAWADGGVREVAVTADDGAHWLPAATEPARGRQWQRFSLRYTPDRAGSVTLASRATSNDGGMQPLSGWRNAIHRVAVTAA